MYKKMAAKLASEIEELQGRSGTINTMLEEGVLSKLCECGAESDSIFQGKPMCEDCCDAYQEYLWETDGPDDHGIYDKTPEELAGEAFQDKLDMYRKEY